MANARGAALHALTLMRRNGMRLDHAAEKVCHGLDSRDSALCLRLCYTVVQQGGLIDAALAELVSFRKTQPQILDILRLGAAQLWFTGRIPRYAVLNESVALARKSAPHAAGLCNAVLRKLPDSPPEIDDPCVRYNAPKWMFQKIAEQLSLQDAERFWEASNRIPPLYFQQNPIGDHPVPEGAVEHPEIEGCLLLSDPKEIGKLCGAGHGIAADPGARMVVRALGPEPGDRIWDCCAAPGGKSFMTAFATGGDCDIVATDRSGDKLGGMQKTAALLGIKRIRIAQMDAEKERPDGLFDAVLCDVPCSGLGVLRKKPDIRFKQQVDVEGLPRIQSAILRNAAQAVKPGGVLLYSTCTVLREENEDVVQAFLQETPEFSAEGFSLPLVGECPEGMTLLLPHKQDTDGFFICKMRRK